MKRQISGLRAASDTARLPDGILLVRVQSMKFQKFAPKPYYTIALIVLEPNRFAGNVVYSRLYCSPRALWKLNWFLRDFGYDSESIERDELEERQVLGLQGVVQISNVVYDGMRLLRFDAFAPASRWEELSPANLDQQAS
jgi:hypothetical protein